MDAPGGAAHRTRRRSDAEVLRVLAFVMAESLQAGAAEVEAIGHILAVDTDKWWAPDEAFFDLLRDKPAINAMLAEVAGKLTTRLAAVPHFVAPDAEG
jgi:hypothetical protein